MAFTGNAHLDEAGKVPLVEMQDDLSSKLPDDLSSKLPSFLKREGFGFTSPGTARYIYVNSGSGNDDTGTGEPGAPYATIQKALNSIASTIYQGAYYIYIAAGTYVENLVAVPVTNAASNTGYGDGHVHIYGNSSDPTTVVIKPPYGINFISNNQLCRTIIEGVTLEGTDGQSTIGIDASAGRVIIKDIILKNLQTGLHVYGEAYVQALSFSTLTIDTDQSSSAGIVCEENSFTELLGSVEMTGIGATYIRVTTGAVFVHRFALMDMVGAGGSEVALYVDKEGVAYIGAGWDLDSMQNGILLGTRGTLYIANASFGINDVGEPVSVGEMAYLVAESSGFNYTGSTPLQVYLAPGAVLYSASLLSGLTPIYYTAIPNSYHGYDLRYAELVAGHAVGTLNSAVTNYLTSGLPQLGIYQLYIATQNEIIEQMDIYMETASGAAKTDTFTVVKNGVDTTMSRGMTNVKAGSTTTNPVSLVAGDRVAIKVASAAATAGANVIAQLKIRKR